MMVDMVDCSMDEMKIGVRVKPYWRRRQMEHTF